MFALSVNRCTMSHNIVFLPTAKATGKNELN